MKRSLLVADDEEATLELLGNLFQDQDLELYLARSGREALAAIERNEIDVILTDLVMPGADGLAVLARAREALPDCQVIIMTGHGTVESAVRAMKMGAFHYITKPFQNAEVVNLVRRALELATVRKENVRLKAEAMARHGPGAIVGASRAIRDLLSVVERVADTDSTVLILGESGTGKELVARAIHYSSRRAAGMLVAVNCSAIPATLLESELFGHVRGAFTGAHASRAGRFEMAHRGTIFLDEIAEMSAPLQAKLLRVLQDQTFIPVGGTKTVRVDVRVIAATNRDLEREIAGGRFREDLYYRLNVVPLRIPPLRERPEDIPLLADHFIRKWNREKGYALQGFREEALAALARYSWPGNVRELENLVERLAILKRSGWFGLEDLPAAVRGDGAERITAGIDFPEEGIDLRKATEAFENRLIEHALERTGGNRSRAAALLGVKRTTLIEMLKRKRIACRKMSSG